jgi:formylglycine-generating enzyme required for sulfatase activity
MSKQEETSAGVSSDPNKVPGRTAGFIIMSVLIVFVAIFMNGQSQRLSENDDENPMPAANLEGFRADAWYLPDEPLLGFVEIPAGAFTMGSNPALDRMAYENERWSSLQRQGEVALPRYYISRYEITQAQLAAFVRATGLAQAALDPTVAGDFPVSNITWPEALAYARWLQEQLLESDTTPVELRRFLESGARVTLPNEAEWEKAARSDDGRIFPWGNRPRNNLANVQSESLVAVGSIDCPDCAWGLADMAGNVWELTRSLMQDYPFRLGDSDPDLQAEPLYVMRGGSFSDGLNNVRSAVRGAVDPGVRNSSIGFRLVISTL